MNWPITLEWVRSLEWARGGNGVLAAAACVLGLVGCSRLARRKPQDTYKRGVVLTEGRSAQRRTARRRKAGEELLTLAGVALAAADETKHFKLLGTTGTGKSTAIRELLGAAIARGDRAVFADPDGGYLLRFHDRYRGDIVLNPFEEGSVKWDLFAEIQNSYDVEQLASGLIPASDDPSASEWRGYARTFLGAVVRRCHVCGRRDLSNLWRLLAVASTDELRPILAGSPAQPFLDPDNARMFGSIRSVTVSASAGNPGQAEFWPCRADLSSSRQESSARALSAAAPGSSASTANPRPDKGKGVCEPPPNGGERIVWLIRTGATGSLRL